MARKTDTDTRLFDSTKAQADEEDLVVFLGKIMTRSEYEIACRNLRKFFDILKSWREGDGDESSEL